MNKENLAPPRLSELEEAATVLVGEFDPKNFRFLSPSGEWEENPKNLRNRVSHELLFRLKSRPENCPILIQELFVPLTQEGLWGPVKIIRLNLAGRKNASSGRDPADIDQALNQLYSPQRPRELHPFLILWEVAVWIIQTEALRIESEALSPEWDGEVKAGKKEAAKELLKLRKALLSSPAAGPQGLFESEIRNLRSGPGRFIGAISKFIAEEDSARRIINSLLAKIGDPRLKEEIDGLIFEKLQPPLGIVTNTSPALLFSCLELLLDERVEISSGIQYMSSVILSILQDPRSAETLLKALRHFPFYLSQIRENLIYSLGCLREGGAVPAIAQVLDEPDEDRSHSLLEQKEEAIWALGKIGRDSLKALPSLVKYADHPSPKLKTYLAWTLGEIGRAQKQHSGGVNADIVIALLKLLKTKSKQVFEESASALKKIDMPGFVHSLYLYNAGAISILGLKPAQRGLYELSETLHYLLRSKKRMVVAVNGDSGTGKTYFCQAISDGFGEFRPEDILYLMRDRKKDQKIFNRMLGLKWLKKYIEPVYYQDYPLTEEEDRPEEFFKEFLEQNKDKKLIMLDGCRDRYYFQRVIDLFYFSGELDVEVNFRATFSSRRLNLESREVAIESVKTHLAFLEEPALEDTQFYQEGIVTLYDFDNSILSRLNSSEVKELFNESRIDSWGDLIKIGDFQQEKRSLAVGEEAFDIETRPLARTTRKLRISEARSFTPEERKFKLNLNENLAEEPYLLEVVGMNDLQPSQIRFYAQDQIAGVGSRGDIFVLTFLDRRIFSMPLVGIRDIVLLGRQIYAAGDGGEIWTVSFERNELALLGKTRSAVTRLASFSRNRIVSGHEDGSVRIWDLDEKRTVEFQAHERPVLALAVDHAGRVYSGSSDGSLKRWDLEMNREEIVRRPQHQVALLKLYPQDKILVATQNGVPELGIFDFRQKRMKFMKTDFRGQVSSISVYYDGRVIAGLRAGPTGSFPEKKNLLMISPAADSDKYMILGGHGRETRNCLTMGPKIITCGVDEEGEHSLKVWGSEFYVKMELSKLSLYPS
jgi:WD40 repeat protein